MKLDQLMTRPSVRGHEARAGLESFGALLCKSWNLSPVTIQWGPIPTACINAQGEITLADMADDATVTRVEVARYAGFLLHELLHRRFTDFKARDSRPYVDRLHNAIEDAWIESRCINSGLAGNARGLLTQLLRGMVDKAPISVNWADPAQYPFSLAVYLRQYGVTVPVPAALMPIYREALRRLPACLSSHDTLALAQWVFDQMQQNQQDQGDQQDGQQGSETGDQQGGQQADQHGDEQGQQQGGQQGPAKGPQGDAEGEDEATPQDTPADAGKAQAPGERTASMEVEPSCPTGKGRPCGTYTSNAQEAGWIASGTPRTLSVQIPGGLRYQVRRLFQNTAQDWQEPGYRSGRLNPGALHRVTLGAEDVFTRRFERDGIDSAAVLVLDLSSSMDANMDSGSSRLTVALACTWALCDTLTQAGVDVAILGFDSGLYRIREFGGTPPLKTRSVLERIRSGGATNDWAAIRLAHDLLLRHSAQRRVAFVIGDGDGKPEWARRQVMTGDRLGIATIGVGIGHDVRHVYGAGSVRVDRAADLGTVAFKQMKAAA